MQAKTKLFSAQDIAAKLVRPGEKVHVITLGCSRNTVDSQVISGALKTKGAQLVGLKAAQVVVVNTCAFVEDAKRESIDAILELIELKKQGKIKRIVVAGCLSQRYPQELAAELKEVDAFTGILPLSRAVNPPQVLLTPKHYAYVKICESCYNQCSFCAIPVIKGKFVSRDIAAVVAEVRRLEADGVKEINLVGQDITAYGMDLYRKKSLARLLTEILAATKNIQWLRLLYMFPRHIIDDLLTVMADNPKICRYVDVPLQHINNRILRAMNRGMDARSTEALLKKIRQRIPGVALRTAFIVGFPGETDAEFQELLDFVKAMRFEKLGVFKYSREEGTRAYSFRGTVPEEVKQRRYELLMQAQQDISRQIQAGFKGKTIKVLIDAKDKQEDNIFLGRSEFDAPEVDGTVFVRSKRVLRPGDFVDARITKAQDYDLAGEVKLHGLTAVASDN